MLDQKTGKQSKSLSLNLDRVYLTNIYTREASFSRKTRIRLTKKASM